MAKTVIVDKEFDTEEKIRAKWDMLHSNDHRPHDLPDTYEEFRDGVLKIQQLFFSINRNTFLP